MTMPLSGDIVFADDIRALVPVVVLKPSSESVSNNATLQNDDHLFAALLPNARYRIAGHVFINAPVTPQIKLAWTWPVSATAKIFMGNLTNQLTNNFLFTTSGGSVGFAGSASDAVLMLRGYIVTGANGGNLQFQWSQNVSNASPTVVQVGSALELVRVIP